MTVRNLLLSLILSLALTCGFTVLYIFYPVLSLVIRGLFRSLFSSDAHTDGIAVVAGGVSGTLLWMAVLLALAFFLVIFAFLQRRSSRH